MTRLRAFLFLGSILSVAGCIVFLTARFSHSKPPLGVVSPPFQRIIAEVGEGKVDATFRIENRGGMDLVVKTSSSSCACTVAAIEPSVVPPGSSGVVTLRATAPAAGQRDVEVRLVTNSEPEPELLLQLQIVGKAPLPFVAERSEQVQFGAFGSLPPPETIWVTTHEKRDDPPWLNGIEVDRDFLKIRGGFVEDGPTLGPAVIRRYRYTAEFQRLPEPGPFRGQVSLFGPESASRVVLPISGNVLRPIEVFPSRLSASLGVGETITMSLQVACSDRGFPLRAELRDAIPGLRVDLRATSDGVASFDVITLGTLVLPLDAALNFKTNHPQIEEISVPVNFRVLKSRSDEAREDGQGGSRTRIGGGFADHLVTPSRSY